MVSLNEDSLALFAAWLVLAGYIAALLKELWSSLECGPEDAVIFMPPAWPVEHVDRNSQKVKAYEA